MGQDLVRTEKTTIPSTGWCMLLHEEQHAMDELPLIPHVLWLHEQRGNQWHHGRVSS